MEPAIDIRVHRIGRLRYRRHRALGQSLPAHCAAYSILYCKYKWQPIRTFTRTRLRSEAWRCTRSSFLRNTLCIGDGIKLISQSSSTAL